MNKGTNQICHDLLHKDYKPDPNSVTNQHINKSLLDSFDDFTSSDGRSGDCIAGYDAASSMKSLMYFFYRYARYAHFGKEEDFDELCKSYWDNKDKDVHIINRELIKASQFIHVEILKRRAKEMDDGETS